MRRDVVLRSIVECMTDRARVLLCELLTMIGPMGYRDWVHQSRGTRGVIESLLGADMRVCGRRQHVE